MASSVGIILRSEKTKTQKYHMSGVPNIPSDEACVLYLGGNETNENKSANGNAKTIETEIIPYLSKPVPVYAVRYDFGDNNRTGYSPERDLSFDRAGANVAAAPRASLRVTLNERNLRNVFRRRVLPRMTDENGDRLPINEIQKYMRRLHLVIEGNFSGVTLRLDDTVREWAAKLGYSESEINDISEFVAAQSEPISAFDSQYIDELFHRVMLPRISDNGARLPVATAMERVRKINVVAHCHGAYVAQRLEEKMWQKMRELGYTPSEMKRIQSQMLIVAHAPACPLGKSHSRFISFMSSYDYMIERPKNWVSQYVRAKQASESKEMMETGNAAGDWLPPSFLSEKNGSVFLIHKGFDWVMDGGSNGPSTDEHNNTHYLPCVGQNMNGKLLGAIAGNILINGIENSMADNFTLLPDTAELVLGDRNRDSMRKIFAKMCENGNKFMRAVYEYATKNVSSIHPQTKQKLSPIPHTSSRQ